MKRPNDEFLMQGAVFKRLTKNGGRFIIVDIKHTRNSIQPLYIGVYEGTGQWASYYESKLLNEFEFADQVYLLSELEAISKTRNEHTDEFNQQVENIKNVDEHKYVTIDKLSQAEINILNAYDDNVQIDNRPLAKVIDVFDYKHLMKANSALKKWRE